ncbi:MAG: hypothetical protein K6G61_01060 [Solobacterium sp.]|nr:hypothetical protein [Solobacterium sp.]
MSQSELRIRLAELLSVIGCVLFVAVFGGKYLILASFDPKYRSTKNTVTYTAIRDRVVEGNILDKDGAYIMGGSYAGMPSYAEYPLNYSYAWLLGYYRVDSYQETQAGLRGNLKQYLMFHLDSNDRGASIKLTTDNMLQNAAYSLLNGREGSITVIDNKTGAVRCFTSQSTVAFDVNDPITFLNSEVEGAQFRRGTFENDPPGSTFKLITAAAALMKAEDEGLDESYFRYNDTGTYKTPDSDFVITNYGDLSYGEIDLEQALNHSVNCYFADLGVRIGARAISKRAEAFMIGKDIEIPYLCTLHSSININDRDKTILAQTAFGQGDTEITPFHLAMIAQAIANDGKMMQPYAVESVSDGTLEIPLHLSRKLSTCMSRTSAEKLKEMMHSTAILYGLDEASYGYVCAKTGTAECVNDRLHTYLIGFTKDASFCISINNGDRSANLYPIAQQLVSTINYCYSR